MVSGREDVVNETDSRFFVGPSRIPGAGNGLFTRVPLVPGERLKVIGVLVEPQSLADRCTEYADAHKIRVDGKLLIPLGFGGMGNHSLQPNLEKMAEAGVLYLQTTRSVAAGEELTFTYSDYARERFGLD